MGFFKVVRQHDSFPVEVSPDYKRMDQKNATTMRAFWDPELTPHIERFFAQRMGKTRRPNDPGFTDKDVALGRGAWCLETDAGGYVSGAGLGGQAFYSWDEEIFPERTSFGDLEEASSVVKQGARFLGADLVGIAPFDERWVYSHSYNPITQEHAPMAFPFEPKSVVVMGIEMKYETIRTARSYLSSAGTGRAYGQMAVTAHCVAEFIRALGYNAIPCGNDTALSVPLAIQAGLGEISRLGLLVSPQFGPRQRICKVFTDLPLQADKPITFGVTEFCKICLRCAKACPTKSISMDREPGYNAVGFSNNPGVKKWYNKLEPCFKYWAAKVDCIVCIASCPYNKPNNLTHKIGIRVAQTPAKKMLLAMEKCFGYGKTFDTKTIYNWWECNREGVPFAKAKQFFSDKPVQKGASGIESHDLPEMATPRAFFAQLAEKLNSRPERLNGANLVFQFNLCGENGGQWYVSVTDGTAEVAEGTRADAHVQYDAKDIDFLALVNGKLNPPLAIVSGKVKVRGEMKSALKIRQILA